MSQNQPSSPPPSPFGNNSTPQLNSASQNPAPPSPAPEPALPWYAKPWATVVALVIFPLQPAGVYLMWKYRTWQRGPKAVATVISLLFFSSLLPKSPDKTASQAATRTASNAPTSNTPVAAKTSAPKAAKNASSTKTSKKSAPKLPRKAAPVEEPLETQSDVSIADAQPEPEQAPREADRRDADRQNVEELDIEGVGKREVGMVDDVVYAILAVETTPSISNALGEQRADGQFYVLTVRAYNNAKETHNVTTQIMKLLDDEGREFDPSTEGTTALQMSGERRVQGFSTQVQPGTAKEFVLVYDAPADASGLRLKIPGGFLSTSGDAVLKLPKEGS